MDSRLNEILEEIRQLERNVADEIRKKEEEFQYSVRKRRVVFEKEIASLHRKFAGSLVHYVLSSRLPVVLSAPVIYAMIVPALILDVCLFVYQLVCFHVYGIPRVARRDHVILDRHYLKYLNPLEKLNCDYCSYFNGLMSYAMEIGARTEQYWCPIKHASATAQRHSRYHLFFDYGDAASYREKLDELQKKFGDIG
ncbi:MAG: hypothetical protein OHK006_14580 [Thermodesulfovibrionales bacterium]